MANGKKQQWWIEDGSAVIESQAIESPISGVPDREEAAQSALSTLHDGTFSYCRSLFSHDSSNISTWCARLLSIHDSSTIYGGIGVVDVTIATPQPSLFTMSGKYVFTNGLKEVRFLFCQSSEHSAATR